MGVNLSGPLTQLELQPRPETLDFDSTLRLAHITDSHVSFPGLYDDVNSRGLAFRLKHLARKGYTPARFPPENLRAVLEDLVKCDVHHLLHSGDVGISGWKAEFQRSRELIENAFVEPLMASQAQEVSVDIEIEGEGQEDGAEDSTPSRTPFGRLVSIIPGNHDLRCPYPAHPDDFGIDYFSRTFADAFGLSIPKLRRLQRNSETPVAVAEEAEEGEQEEEESPFPYVKLLDPYDVVVIGLDSRNLLPRGAKMHGEVTQEQIDAADELLLHVVSKVAETDPDPDRAERLIRIVIMHHPPVIRWRREFIERKVNLNLEDRTRVQDFCRRHRIDLLLCGHTHIGNATNIGRTLVIEGQTSNGQNFLAKLSMIGRPPSSIIYHFNAEMKLVRVEKRERTDTGEFWSKWYWWDGDLEELRSLSSPKEQPIFSRIQSEDEQEEVMAQMADQFQAFVESSDEASMM